MSDPTRPLPDHLARVFEAGLQRRRLGPRGRYAPSPTGPLHLGNLSTALVSWLVTRLQGGEWLLRLDDLDRPRNRPGAIESILSDLSWLGLGWDGAPVLQSERRGLYASTLSWLRRSGALYPCRCSRRLLADISAPHGALAVYPGTCSGLDPAWGPLAGRLPSWRLRLPAGRLQWQERLAPGGELHGASQVGDVVLRRADGLVAYHLATAVDELGLGISDVVRGHDLWQATGAQVAVLAALGAPAPAYWHGPLRLDGSGQRLAKRSGAEGLAALRERGLDGPAVVGLLAADLDLVAPGSRLSAAELLEDLRHRQVSQQDLKLENSNLEDLSREDLIRENPTIEDLKLQGLKPGDSKFEGARHQPLSLEEPLRRLVAAQIAAAGAHLQT